MKEYDISRFFDEEKAELFDDCRLICAEECRNKIRFTLAPDRIPRKGYRIIINRSGFRGKIHVLLGGGEGNVVIDTVGHANIDVRMFRKSTLHIGRGTTINSARIVCDNSDVYIGDDGLWSDEIIVQSNDQHGIIDIATGKVLNSDRRKITIEDHVWVGRRTMIMPDTSIAKGSILAAGAILTSDVPQFSVFAGVPARLVKSGVSWSRGTDGLSEWERNRLSLDFGQSGAME